MSLDVRSILAGRNLTGVIQAIKPGLPEDCLPSELFDSSPSVVEGDSGTYYKVNGSRKTAKLSMYGSPSRRRTLSGVTEQPVKLAHYTENVEIKAATLVNLESEDGSRQRLGESEVARQVEEVRQIMDNTRVAMLASAILSGYLYADGDGNILPSSSGATLTVDYGVPAGNRNQLDVFGAGAIISASWGTAGTSIVKQIQLLKKAARKKTGYPVEIALYGENILDYFLNNTQLKEIINRNPGYQAAFSQGEIPDGFLGLDWYPAYQFFYDDKDGTLQSILGADGIVFMPRPDVTWFEWKEGTYPIPSEVGIAGKDLSAALASVRLAQGMFAYGKLTDDPVGVTMVYGDTVLPIIKVPNAIFIADVTP